MLIFNSYKNYNSADFQLYCKSNNIISFCLSAYLFYLIQPLDIECFNILKQLYNLQIKHFIKAYINYIFKIKFFIVFKTVYN